MNVVAFHGEVNGEVVDSIVNFVVPLVEIIDHFIDGGLGIDCD